MTVRVYHIAKRAGVDSKFIIGQLPRFGVIVRSASEAVEPIFAEVFLDWLERENNPWYTGPTFHQLLESLPSPIFDLEGRCDI